jgi:hypothetical protein
MKNFLRYWLFCYGFWLWIELAQDKVQSQALGSITTENSCITCQIMSKTLLEIIHSFLIQFVKRSGIGLNWLRIGFGGLTSRTGRNKFAGDMCSGDLISCLLETPSRLVLS